MVVELDEALARYRPEVTAAGEAVLTALEALVPGASPVVFVAKYAVTVSLTFTGKWRDGFCFVAFFAKHANLEFHRGAELPDPTGILRGDGKIIRHVRIDSPDMLTRPEIRALVLAAAERCPR